MDRLKLQTARVNWRMGQSLLPEHFRAQEQGLREEMALRLGLGSVPSWGVGSLEIDEYELARGILLVRQLIVILPGGQLIDVPGNAAAPEPLSLEETGSVAPSIYLILESGDRVVVSDEEEGGLGDNVERAMYSLRLSSSSDTPARAQVFKLCVVEKSPDGNWRFSRGYLPPTFRIGDVPYFRPVIEEVEDIVSKLHRILREDSDLQYLAGESLVSVQQTMRELLRFRSHLGNVGKELHPHPYDFFQSLQGLYLDFCVYREKPPEPESISRVYRHDQLAGCFDEVLKSLREQIELPRSAMPYVPFDMDLQEGLRVCHLPPEPRRALQVYLLLQKPRVGMKLDLKGVKLASRNRITAVHQRALTGIPFRPIPDPPFHHHFSSEVEFYALSPGEEWDYVVREGELVFFEREELREVRAFVYWRNDRQEDIVNQSIF